MPEIIETEFDPKWLPSWAQADLAIVNCCKDNLIFRCEVCNTQANDSLQRNHLTDIAHGRIDQWLMRQELVKYQVFGVEIEEPPEVNVIFGDGSGTLIEKFKTVAEAQIYFDEQKAREGKAGELVKQVSKNF